jgi:hypothetical protein
VATLGLRGQRTQPHPLTFPIGNHDTPRGRSPHAVDTELSTLGMAPRIRRLIVARAVADDRRMTTKPKPPSQPKPRDSARPLRIRSGVRAGTVNSKEYTDEWSTTP